MRLYAATGDGIARLDEYGEAWIVELSLAGSGAQCLAVGPDDSQHRVRRVAGEGGDEARDAGRGWVVCDLPGAGCLLSLAVSPVDERCLRRHGARSPVPQHRRWRELAGARRAPRASVPAELELSASAVDPTRALDRAKSPRGRNSFLSGSSSAGSLALQRQRGDLAGSPSRAQRGRALARLAFLTFRVRRTRRVAAVGTSLDAGETCSGQRRPRPQLHLGGHRQSP